MQITLNLAPQDLDLVLEGLGKLPYERVAALIHGVSIEGRNQVAAAREAADAAARRPRKAKPAAETPS